jgi:regulator of sigma D
MSKVIEERRAASRHLIRELVAVRDHVLSLYGRLASLHPFSDIERSRALLEEFCQALIDYTADAHFRLYRYIDERRERRQPVIEVANRVYPAILATTDAILRFNDRYDFGKGGEGMGLENLGRELSELGERLADRIELEDQVISALTVEKA